MCFCDRPLTQKVSLRVRSIFVRPFFILFFCHRLVPRSVAALVCHSAELLAATIQGEILSLNNMRFPIVFRRKTLDVAILFLLLVLLAPPRTANAQRCGCDTCNATVLGTDANGQTCEARIDSYMAEGSNETEACRDTAVRYPLACNPGW